MGVTATYTKLTGLNGAGAACVAGVQHPIVV
jgi:hypothetical protein